MHLPIILAHGVVGPLDEILPPVLLGGILGMIVITWWNGRKTAVPPPAPPIDTTLMPITRPGDESTPADPMPGDESHFPVS